MSSNFTKEGKDLWTKATSGVVQQLVRERDKTFTRTSGTITKRDDIVDDLVRASASGVGFFSEVAHYRQNKKDSTVAKDDETSHPETEEPNSQRVHDAIWELDDAEQRITTQDVADEAGLKPSKDSGDLATAFLKRNQADPDKGHANSGELALPVVLPQRRPKTRVRGFVRAYPPILADAGIDEKTFLDFIDTFNKSLVPNPYLYAINLAGLADLISPDPALTAFGIVLGVAVEGIMEAQSRFKSNTFLDRVNEDFFAPHGLVCFVATWKPDTSESEVAVGFDGKTSTSGSESELPRDKTETPDEKRPEKDQFKNIQQKFARRMKAHNGAFGWSQPAPLVFPASLEKLKNSQGKVDEKKKNALDRAEIWLDGYLDKRSQVDWIDGNPDHLIASSIPRPGFKSRYADPSHPAASGDIVALVTGGTWQYKRKEMTSKKDEGGKHPAQLHVEETSKSDDANGVKRKADDDSENARDTRNGDEGTAPGLEEGTQTGQQEESFGKVTTDDDEQNPFGPLTKAEAKAQLKEKMKEERRAEEIQRKLKEKEAKELKKQQKRTKEEEKKKLKEEKKTIKDQRQGGITEGKNPRDIIRSLFQNDVLYLIIMSLPQNKDVIDVPNTTG
ncbi:FAD binding domain protein [Colletotrichum karsti]|uniref:FAD binding domain protein n=1 Tax=Colletotrichum karsti TaxID=1095194 RepID=A0A9P6LP73_9PEZI|nr:FAD binding domain protein [Colletotrichum karsti]KAF9880500.1 FAD binding domain protein [Colletotrichum karsti]